MYKKIIKSRKVKIIGFLKPKMTYEAGSEVVWEAGEDMSRGYMQNYSLLDSA